jgi:hypothetical protein
MRLEDFVSFWSQLYRDPRERHYSDNIGQPLTPERVRSLYLWKNGGKLSERKCESVERNVIGRLRELERIEDDRPPLDFLLRFAEGGPIWRVFLLHIWQPRKYPIYDQHVYRAMRFITCSRIEKIPPKCESVAKTYVSDYIPFFNRFPQTRDRGVDKALFAFGKFLKTPLGRRIAVADGRQE